MSSALVSLSFLGLALFGVPIFCIMGGLSLSLFHLEDIELSAVAIEMYRLASSPTLISIPLFTLAGYILAESQGPKRLLNLAKAVLGNLPGALPLVCLIVSAFFTAFTGASGVTIIALGGLIYPMLKNNGYSEDYTLGFVTTTGSLGLLFPPSLPVILYGIVAKVDIDQVFLAGIIPGFILIILIALYSIFVKKPGAVTASKNEKKISLKQAMWEARFEIPLPIIILVGIYGGYVTVTEASSLTLTYVFIMVFFLYRDLPLKKLVIIIKESMTLVGSILIILCCALGLTNYLVDEEIPLKILQIFKEYISNKYVFLLFINIFLLVVGSLMDIFSAIIVVLPLIMPIAQSFDIHPLHLAIIFLTNLEIGYITPPVGINLFISSFRFNKSIFSLYRSSFPFFILLIIGLLLVTYLPFLSLLFTK